jgi:heme/copper-type cytochrome/quinol oxidase subunit 2
MKTICITLATVVVVAVAGTCAALAAPPATRHVTLTIKSDAEHAKKGSDGKWHDAYLPGNFTIKAGARVVVTVRNYDDAAHTFTAPGLKLDVKIKGGSATHPSTTTFSFVAWTRGTFSWHCEEDCDGWAMTHHGYMRGRVTVT